MRIGRALFTKLDTGTIGPRPCEVVLEKILNEHRNSLIVRKAMRRVQYFKRLMAQTSGPNAEYIAGIVLEDQKERWNTTCRNMKMPENVRTHVLCVITSYYRELLD